MSPVLPSLLYLLFSFTNSEWIYSSGSPILIGESLRSSNAFFNSFTIDNVSITCDSDDPLSLNFYLIGGNLTSHGDISTFITWIQSTDNQCTQQAFGVDHTEYNISFPTALMDIFYRCGFVVHSGINMTLIFQFVSEYQVWLSPYKHITWILEISPPSIREYSVYIAAERYNDFFHPQFYVDTLLSNIVIQHTQNYKYWISYECEQCQTLWNGGNALWNMNNIWYDNSKSFWLFTQEFNPKEINIANLTSFEINIECGFEYILIPHLIGLSLSAQFTRDLLEDYMTNQISWPSPHFHSNNRLKIITSNETVPPLYYPNIMELEGNGIDLREKDYYVWILWLRSVNMSDSGICLFQRTAGKKENDYLNGDSIQMTIPFDSNLYLDDYQDFLITMTGEPFPTTIPPTNFPTKYPTILPTDNPSKSSINIPSNIPSNIPTVTPTSIVFIYSTDENIYQVQLIILMKYNNDITTNDIYVIQTIINDLLEQNVNGIMDDTLKVSVSFDSAEKTITMSINAEFINEDDADKMVKYANNGLVPDLWKLLSMNSNLGIIINDIDVETEKIITSRYIDTDTNDNKNTEEKESNFMSSIIRNKAVLFGIIGIIIFCCICIICIIFIIKCKNKSSSDNNKEKSINIRHSSNVTGIYPSNVMQMVGISQMSGSDSRIEYDAMSSPLPSPPPRILNLIPGQNYSNNDVNNLPKLPESYNNNNKPKTNVFIESGQEGFNYNVTSTNSMDNVPKPPLPPMVKPFNDDNHDNDDNQSDDMYSDHDGNNGNRKLMVQHNVYNDNAMPMTPETDGDGYAE